MFLTISRLTHQGLRVLDAHASDALGRYEVLQIGTLLNGVTKEKCVQIFLTKYQVFTSSNGNKHDLSFPSQFLKGSNSFSKASNPQPLSMQDKTKYTFSYVNH